MKWWALTVFAAALFSLVCHVGRKDPDRGTADETNELQDFVLKISAAALRSQVHLVGGNQSSLR